MVSLLPVAAYSVSFKFGLNVVCVQLMVIGNMDRLKYADSAIRNVIESANQKNLAE